MHKQLKDMYIVQGAELNNLYAIYGLDGFLKTPAIKPTETSN